MSETIAACQLKDISDGGALEQIVRYAKMADKQDVDVLCFPECYLQGYTRDKQLAEQRAVKLGDATFRALLGRTAAYSTTLIVGLIERVDSVLYNTAAVLKQGELIGCYRKTHPNEGIFEAGSEFPTFSTGEITFGINICNDANYPDAADQLLKGNPRVIFYPLNNRLPVETAEKWRDKHIQNLVDRAVQTNCWVVSADVIHEDSATVGYGFTAVVDPTGTIVTRADELTEQMVVARI